MADVPAWVLILNTAAVGGFGLLGSYIVPRAQREARKFEARRADDATMRDKAALIFEEISKIERSATQFAVTTTRKLVDKDQSPLEGEVHGWDTLRALVAVYYPAGLQILDDHMKRMAEHMKPVQALAKQAARADNADQLPNLRAMPALTAMAHFTEAAETTKTLREFMIRAVEPYSPRRQ